MSLGTLSRKLLAQLGLATLLMAILPVLTRDFLLRPTLVLFVGGGWNWQIVCEAARNALEGWRLGLVVGVLSTVTTLLVIALNKRRNLALPVFCLSALIFIEGLFFSMTGEFLGLAPDESWSRIDWSYLYVTRLSFPLAAGLGFGLAVFCLDHTRAATATILILAACSAGVLAIARDNCDNTIQINLSCLTSQMARG